MYFYLKFNEKMDYMRATSWVPAKSVLKTVKYSQNRSWMIFCTKWQRIYFIG